MDHRLKWTSPNCNSAYEALQFLGSVGNFCIWIGALITCYKARCDGRDDAPFDVNFEIKPMLNVVKSPLINEDIICTHGKLCRRHFQSVNRSNSRVDYSYEFNSTQPRCKTRPTQLVSSEFNSTWRQRATRPFGPYLASGYPYNTACGRCSAHFQTWISPSATWYLRWVKRASTSY